MRKGLFIIGLLLLFFPIIVVGLLSKSEVTEIDTVINTSFIIEPGEKLGGLHVYEEGTYYHTTLLANPLLKGTVSVEGEGIYFKCIENGMNVQGYTNRYVDHQLDFTVDAIASEQYFFIFNNTEGNATSYVSFILKEEWTQSRYPLGVILRWFFLSLFLVSPVGLILLIISYFRY